MDAASKPNTVGSLSSTIESDYSKANDITYLPNDKIDVISQNNMDSVSEPVTPKDDLSKVFIIFSYLYWYTMSVYIMHAIFQNHILRFSYHCQTILRRILRRNWPND